MNREEEAVDSALAVMLVYQDPVTREWASKLWEQVAEPLGHETVRVSMWKIADLTHPAVLPGALRTATEADILIIALRASREVPVELTVWLDNWLPRRQRTGGILVAVIGMPALANVESPYVQSYLQSVAERAGLEFMSRWCQLPAETHHPLDPRQLQAKSNVTTAMLADLLQYRPRPDLPLGSN